MSEKRKSTFGLGLGQLADIFAMATKDQASTERNCTEECLVEMLRHQLTEIMPGNSLLFATASKISEYEQRDVISLAERSLQEVLFNPESSVQQLQIIKEAGKLLTTSSDSKVERALATTIYHAAIASCLVHNGKKITQHSYEKLDESFALLIEKTWMTNELIELFSKARRICQSKWNKK